MKWEYKIANIVCVNYEGVDEYLSDSFCGYYKNLTTALDSFGQEGWELVTSKGDE